MKKYRDHTTEINQVNWDQVVEQAGETKVIFAVDVAKEKGP